MTVKTVYAWSASEFWNFFQRGIVALTGRHDADETDPGEPGNLSEGLDATEAETNRCSNGNEASRACTVKGNRVERDRGT